MFQDVEDGLDVSCAIVENVYWVAEHGRERKMMKMFAFHQGYGGSKDTEAVWMASTGESM